MANYSDIIGHSQIKEQLKNAVSLGKVSHAYIFHGPKDSGKMMLAEAFAKALQCENNDPCGCGNCKSCRQAVGHNQPDIIYVQREKASQYSVKELREQLVGDMSIKPYSSKYKIYIVDEAEKMKAESQNAILKTIEEPPAYGIVLLLTSNVDSLLPTIRSRCVQMDLKSVSDQEICTYLMKEHQIPDYQAKVAAAFAQGNVGRAVGLATSTEFVEKKSKVLALVKQVRDANISSFADKIKELDIYKEDMQEFFDLMQIWYRDLLYFKSTNKTEGLIYQDEIYDIKKQAEKISYLGMQNALDSIEKARVRLSVHGNFELTMEILLLELKEI